MKPTNTFPLVVNSYKKHKRKKMAIIVLRNKTEARDGESREKRII
jgi:hypothetical protein